MATKSITKDLYINLHNSYLWKKITIVIYLIFRRDSTFFHDPTKSFKSYCFISIKTNMIYELL